MISTNKVCFIIAHKYFRGYDSYIQYYVNNIQSLYPEALTIVVDNNSTYAKDVLTPLESLENVVILTNNIDSKFELGAYQVGLRYIFDNSLQKEYSYFIFTQDNFVLKNKYDFTAMYSSNEYARPINSFYADGECRDVCVRVMEKLNMNNHWDKINFCWCSSFVVANNKVFQLYEYLKEIVVTTRWESCAGERYLARILWELNEHKDCGDLDGSAADLAIRHYDTWNVDIYAPASSYFVKKVQQKNEHTVDRDIPQPIVHVTAAQLKDLSDNKKT